MKDTVQKDETDSQENQTKKIENDSALNSIQHSTKPKIITRSKIRNSGSIQTVSDAANSKYNPERRDEIKQKKTKISRGTRNETKKSITSIDKKRKDAAERKRKQRERIKADINKYELYKNAEKVRSRKRIEEGKIKNIDDMSEREKRAQRKLWRKSYHRCKNNLKKRKDEELIRQQNTPPASDAEEPVFVDIQLQNAAVRSLHRNAV
ncbi:unnamed protein product [Brassicogethes aeneus]|uniref:Uncharacterized protein n=1 Tax=Brassicogethes aeneus TaxID=1431903 RepID=A0A9P0B3W8_BRAAE|nr:unnamed protein product [Brassicogethes aeneus]